MSKKYDVIVIGTGVAGGKIAAECAKAGKSVAITDSREYGGTCALRGCNPKKVLVNAAEVIHRSRALRNRGLIGDIGVIWPELVNFEKKFTEGVPEYKKKRFKELGVDMYHGEASFTSKDGVVINNEELIAEFIVIATGAKPRKLNIPGEEHILTSDDFLELENLEGTILFVGGGYISCELAHVASNAGSLVTILEYADRPLLPFEADTVEMFMKASRDYGIDIRVNTPVTSVEKTDEKFLVYTNDGGKNFEADLVVHGAGRVPNIDGLNLDKGGVSLKDNAILINDFMQSVSNPGVFIAGDVNSDGIPLTPVAYLEAKTVTEYLINGKRVKPDYKGIPKAVFTLPPLSSVGLNEEEAKEKGYDYEVNYKNTSSESSTKRLGLRHSCFKIITEKDHGKILGAHLMGHNADEVINIFALAIRLGIGVEDLKKCVWTYPTFTYQINEMLR